MKQRRRKRGAAKAARRRLPRGEPLVTWSLRLPASLDNALKLRAAKEYRSANSMAVVLLERALVGELSAKTGEVDDQYPNEDELIAEEDDRGI